ncbi:MAG: stage III sporulation protein AA [Lachnospiraceae bacterium]|nr:stage III sporulation protein AA [Lachnospiraceae bacterium]
MNQRDELLKIFPLELREYLHHLDWYREDLEEIRIRVGQPLQFIYGGRYTYIKDSGNGFTDQWEHSLRVSSKQVQEMMMYLCEYSRYAYAKQLKNGFISLAGGIRVGVAGEAIRDDAHFQGVEHPMFLNIRIPREYKGCADWALPYLFDGERLYHTLILAPPGAGKTTLLRDLLRQISNERNPGGVAILDERYEIAACHRGVPMNDVGLHSDVYSGYDKAVGCMQAIRTMAPQVVAMDEIGGEEEGAVLSYAMRCGISVVATMHAGSFGEYEEIRSRKDAYRSLKFQRIIWVAKDDQGRRIYELKDDGGKLLCVNT